MFDLCNVTNRCGCCFIGSNSEWDGCPTSLAPAKFENFYALGVNVLCAVGTEGSK